MGRSRRHRGGPSPAQLTVKRGRRHVDVLCDVGPCPGRRLSVQAEPGIETVRQPTHSNDLDAGALTLHLPRRRFQQIEHDLGMIPQRLDKVRTGDAAHRNCPARDRVAVIRPGEKRCFRKQPDGPCHMQRQGRSIGQRTFEGDRPAGQQKGAFNRIAPSEQGFACRNAQNGTPREDFVADTALLSADRDADGSDPAMAAALAYLQRS